MANAREFFANLFEPLTGRETSQSLGPFMHGALCADGLGPCDQRSGCGYEAEFTGTYCVLHGVAIGDHSSCILNICRVCANPVTNGQVSDNEAHPIDERGRDDGEHAHDECVQGTKYGD
jgi:hypothetical protein